MKEGRGGRFRLFVPSTLYAAEFEIVFQCIQANCQPQGDFLGPQNFGIDRAMVAASARSRMGHRMVWSPKRSAVLIMSTMFPNMCPATRVLVLGPNPSDHTCSGSWDVSVSCWMRNGRDTKMGSSGVLPEKPAATTRNGQKSGA